VSKLHTVVWLSGGISSFMAAVLCPIPIDELIYIDIEDQTRDTLRFVNEAAAYLDKPLTILKAKFFRGKNDVIRSRRYVNGTSGAPCTGALKRMPRKEWEWEHKGCNLCYVWGYDLQEQHRVDRIVEDNQQARHLFPLVDMGLNKAQVHGMFERIGIQKPDMYRMGYPNQNCVGCVKGGMGYWNKIRVDFPEDFAEMAALEREIGATCLKDEKGKVWLGELDPDRGDMNIEIFPECGIACYMHFGSV